MIIRLESGSRWLATRIGDFEKWQPPCPTSSSPAPTPKGTLSSAPAMTARSGSVPPVRRTARRAPGRDPAVLARRGGPRRVGHRPGGPPGRRDGPGPPGGRLRVRPRQLRGELRLQQRRSSLGKPVVVIVGVGFPSTRAPTGSRLPATRCAPGSASRTRLPPSCRASSARARACRREPPEPPDPASLAAPAGATRSAERGPAASVALLDRHREGVATYRDGLAEVPAGPQPARPAGAGLPAAGAEGLRPGSPGEGTVSGNGRPFTGIREPAALPCRQLIRQLIGVPVNSGVPFRRRTCRTRRE